MEAGTVVKNLTSGEIGVVAQDIMNCCSSTEEPVVYDGSDAFIGTERGNLEAVGIYDSGIEDPKRCGLGLGKFACKYLGISSGGPTCLRFSTLRNMVIFSNMEAQGSPTHLFPRCQDNIQLASLESGLESEN